MSGQESRLLKIVPNMGRVPEVAEPTDMAWAYKEREGNAVVYLAVYFDPDSWRPSHKLTWDIAWDIEVPPHRSKCAYYRRLRLYPTPEPGKLANYGPKTTAPVSGPVCKVDLAVLDWERRRQLEDIASNAVYCPDTNGSFWGPVDWIKGVLGTAVDCGIFERHVVDSALELAQQAIPPSP